MPDSVSVPGEKRGDTFTLSQRKYFEDVIRQWPDGPITITAKRQRPGKTVRQLGYYYGIVLPLIAEETGNDKDTVHAELKRMFCTERREWVNKVTGETEQREYVRSLADLSTKEMAEFLDRVILWAGDLPLIIPAPDASWRDA